jgi:hypothetical protein
LIPKDFRAWEGEKATLKKVANNRESILQAGRVGYVSYAEGRVGLKSVSGYEGVKFDKSFTDKQLCVLAVLKKRVD